MKKSTIPWNKFGELKSMNELEEYLGGREYGHGGYFHYTTLDIINNILQEKEFWISNVSNFNDELDKQQFNQQNLFYSLCFSTGVNENLPLWYLYSGMDGRGGRLGLSKAYIKRLIEHGTYTLYEMDGNSKNTKSAMQLVNDISMKIEFRDMLYQRTDFGDKAFLKYNTMTNHIISSEDVDIYNNCHPGFSKGLIWYYEKETRLLVKLIGDAAAHVQNQNDKEYVVVLKIPDDVYKKIKIRLAPGIRKDEDLFSEKKAIQKYILDTSGLGYSEHAGETNMNLCKKCSAFVITTE